MLLLMLIKVYQDLAADCDYALHLGLTEALFPINENRCNRLFTCPRQTDANIGMLAFARAIYAYS